MMRRSKLAKGSSRLWYSLVFVALLVVASALMAADEGDDQDEFSRKGADTCISCHDEEAILSIFRTPHGHPVDANAPFAHEQCESCHQAGAQSALLRLPRRKAWSISLGTCAGPGGLYLVPQCARLEQSRLVDAASAIALPAMSFTSRASEYCVYQSEFAGHHPVAIRRGRELHELPFPCPRQ